MKFWEESCRTRCRDTRSLKCCYQSQSSHSSSWKGWQMRWESCREIVWIWKRSFDRRILRMTSWQYTRHRLLLLLRRRSKRLRSWNHWRLRRKLLRRWWLRKSSNTFFKRDKSTWNEMTLEILQWSSERRTKNTKYRRRSLKRSEQSWTFYQELRVFWLQELVTLTISWSSWRDKREFKGILT